MAYSKEYYERYKESIKAARMRYYYKKSGTVDKRKEKEDLIIQKYLDSLKKNIPSKLTEREIDNFI